MYYRQIREGSDRKLQVQSRGTGVTTTVMLISSSISLTHDLVLPIWKSNVSITLMIEKKAKRYVWEQHGCVGVTQVCIVR